MRGKLFTQDYLEEGIAQTDAWRALSDAGVALAEERLAELFEAFPVAGTPTRL